MIIVNCEQGSEEWHKLRIGNPGASGFSNIITSTGKPSTSRQKYLYKLAGEMITGTKPDTYKSASMARGNELEPDAKEVFEFTHGSVTQCGIVYPGHTKDYHISPDGMQIEREAGLEIKCPELHTAVEYLDKGKLPAKYVVQVQGSLMVTGFKAWWFVSYYPGLKPLMLKIERDENLIRQIKKAVEEFCADLKSLVWRLGGDMIVRPKSQATAAVSARVHLHKTDTWRKWTEAKENCPDIAEGLQEPVTEQQCIEATRHIIQKADEANQGG